MYNAKVGFWVGLIFGGLNISDYGRVACCVVAFHIVQANHLSVGQATVGPAYCVMRYVGNNWIICIFGRG